MQELSPIALFVYNRPNHTRQTVEALLKNELAVESDLYIFSDAPKNSELATLVMDVRDYVRTISGFKSVNIIEQTKNIGLANSIIMGVTSLCKKYGRVIVLEDDIVTSHHFLRFMNDSLCLYEQDAQVVSIHGYMFPVKSELPETFFLKGANSWGWATWSRAWQLFEPDGIKLLDEMRRRRLIHEFDLNGSYPYSKMLEDQIAGKNDSWAIRWRASVFLSSGLTLFPGVSLVRNIGFDSSGVHCGNTDEFEVILAEEAINVLRIPLEECEKSLDTLRLYYRAQKLSIVGRILRRFRRVL